MPTIFLAIAFTMLLAAAALVFYPLQRMGGRAHTAAPVTALAIPLAALALYGLWSEWHWPQPDPEIARLTSAARSGHDDPAPWLELGQSHAKAGQFQQALTALDRAYALNAGRDSDTALSVIETLSMIGAVPAERLTEMIDEVLSLHPHNPQAQWYAAELAFGRGEFSRATELWRALLTRAEHDTRPEAVSVREILNRRIAQAEAHGATSGSDVSSGSALTITVTRAAELSADVPADTPLFVLARALDGPGPPLAVERHAVSELPLTVELSDADAMMAGRNLSAHDQVEIVARIALGGGPVAVSGDLFGSVRVDRGATDAVTVVIDKVTP